MKIKDLFLTQDSFDVIPTKIDGILQTSPIPKNIGKYYESEDYISHHQDENSLKQKVYKLAQSLNLNYKSNVLTQSTIQNARVLDYGCGAGEFVKYIQKDFTVFGFEPNADAKNIAQEKATNAKIINNLDEIENNSLDAITLWHVFEHVENQEEMIEIFNKKLKSNGVLIIAVPNYQSYDAKHYKEFWAAFDVPRHLYHFSKIGMKNLFHNQFWNLENIKPLILDAYYISILSEKYKKNPLFWLKGGIFGAISNFKALKTGEYSSLIYIIRKN